MKAYRIINSINNKSYIGITKGDINRRFQSHLTMAKKGKDSALYNAIRKYGKEFFSIEHIASSLSLADLPELEKVLIIQHQTKCPHGYNMTDGGDGTSGWKPSEQQRKEASIRMKAYYKTETEAKKEQRAKSISNAKIGKPNIKLKGQKSSLKGITRTQEFKDKISESMKQYTSGLAPGEMGRRRSSNADPVKIGIAAKARWEGAEYRKNMSKKLKASCALKWQDPAQKIKIKEAMQEVWRKRKAGLLPMPITKAGNKRDCDKLI